MRMVGRNVQLVALGIPALCATLVLGVGCTKLSSRSAPTSATEPAVTAIASPVADNGRAVPPETPPPPATVPEGAGKASSARGPGEETKKETEMAPAKPAPRMTTCGSF